MKLYLATLVIFGGLLSCKNRGESVAFAQSANAPLRSTAAKKFVCKRLLSDLTNAGFNNADCLAGQFQVSKEFKDTVGGREVTTRLNVNVAFGDKRFSTSIAKAAGVNDDGKISITRDWASFKLLNQELGNTSIIMQTHEHSNNVRLLDDAQDLPSSVSEWHNYAERPDYDLNNIQYFKILKPGSNTTIGYIVVEDACSYEAEDCYTSRAKFDINGNMIGEIYEESRGIDE
jgi:hypothetical protein